MRARDPALGEEKQGDTCIIHTNMNLTQMWHSQSSFRAARELPPRIDFISSGGPSERSAITKAEGHSSVSYGLA